MFLRMGGRYTRALRHAVDAWRRHRNEDEAVKVTEAIFTFVAIDEHKHPRPIDQEQ